MALTELQREERKNYIGGSDCGTICGVNKYGNIIDLWQEKLGLKEIEDISDKPVIRAGNYLEPVVAQWFQDDTGKLVEIANETFYHKDIPFMAANIDRRLTDENAILECKTAGRDDNWGSDGDNTFPDYYMCQLAHYCAVCDIDRAYIAVLIRGSDFRWYTFNRNQKLEDMIIKKEKEFWDCVKNETPPNPRTNEEIISLYSQANNEEVLIANEDIEYTLHLLKERKITLKTLEEEIKQDEVKIKAFMKNHDIINGQNGRPLVTWKNAKGAVRFDAKKFALEHEKLYEQYLKTSEPTRRFVIK